MKRYRMFIDGAFVDHGGAMVPVVNPATEEVVSEAPAGERRHVDAAVDAADRAQKGWAKLAAVERAAHLYEIAAAVRAKVDFLAETLSEEQGKVLSLAKAEVASAADYFD